MKATISDKNGNALFHSNGYAVFNMDGSVMPNGDGLYTTSMPAFYPFGPPVPMSMMALPRPGHDNDYYLIHLEWGPGWWDRQKLVISLITNAAVSGQGSVAWKNRALFDKGHWLEFFQATKHANGRDWWIVLSDADSITQLRTFYSFFIGTDTAYLASTQYIDGYEPVPPVWKNGTWQRIFSPDGKYLLTLDLSSGIHLHTFDRCSGLLGPLKTIPYTKWGAGYGAIVVSSNSRFLYLSTTYAILQYDLAVQDGILSADTIGIYDGFMDTLFGVKYPTWIGLGQHGPDGKIYYMSSTRIHYIAKPNKIGKACDFIQHRLKMPTYAQFPLYYPNYRLGPLDGSPCDTLGLNNEPLADFWWFTDSTLTVEFADNSFYEPALWYWDFGDGGGSQDTNPAHTFPAPGIYTVCLTVSNQYAADTVCKQVQVGVTTSVPGLGKKSSRLNIRPNPAQDKVSIQLPSTGMDAGRLEIFDAHARLQHSIKAFQGISEIEVSTAGWLTGIYFCRLITDGQAVITGKFLVQH